MTRFEFANMAMHDPSGPIDPHTRRLIRAQAMRHFRTQQRTLDAQQKSPPDAAQAVGIKRLAVALQQPPPSALPPDFGVVYHQDGVKLRDVKYWYFATAGSSSHMSFLPRLWDLSLSDALLFECAVSRGLDRKMELLGSEIDCHYLSSRQRIIQQVQVILTDRGCNVTTSVIIAVALLAWLDILIGDLAGSLMHFRGLQQLEVTEEIDQTTWFYITWPVLRLALLHGEEPTLVSKSFPLPLAWSPQPDSFLVDHEEKAYHNSRNTPECPQISSSELAQLFRYLHIHSSNPSNTKIYDKNLHALEYQLAILMARFRQITRPDNRQSVIGLVLHVAHIRAWSVLHMRVSAREAAFRSILHQTTQLLESLDVLTCGHMSCMIWISVSLLSFRPDLDVFKLQLRQCIGVLNLKTPEELTLVIEDWPWPEDDDLATNVRRIWAEL